MVVDLSEVALGYTEQALAALVANHIQTMCHWVTVSQGHCMPVVRMVVVDRAGTNQKADAQQTIKASMVLSALSGAQAVVSRIMLKRVVVLGTR